MFEPVRYRPQGRQMYANIYRSRLGEIDAVGIHHRRRRGPSMAAKLVQAPIVSPYQSAMDG